MSGGLIVGSWLGGPTTLTDTYFEFSGFTAEYRLLSGTGLPATLDYFSARFGSGVYSIVAPVPLPPAGWLLGKGLIGLVGRRLRRRCAPPALRTAICSLR